jgi:hypothetical protein
MRSSLGLAACLAVGFSACTGDATTATSTTAPAAAVVAKASASFDLGRPA